MRRARTLVGATVLHLDPLRVSHDEIRVEGTRIVDVGPHVRAPGDEVVDLAGRIVMPGLVCGHHHLYSALACGMPLPASPPTSFGDMLDKVWWKLDRNLDEEGVRVSALVGGLEAVRKGTTTIIDHHASPGFIVGSLEALDEELHHVGVRRILAYEITDRGTPEQSVHGLDAHRARLARGPEPMSATLVGLHASFTVSNTTLTAAATLARDHGVGLHVHVGEALDDQAVTGRALVDRYAAFAALVPGSIFAHGVHLSDPELERLATAGVLVAHQARSNMNNAVGRARPARFPPGSFLGTDGLDGDMLTELKTAYFRAQEAMDGLAPADLVGFLVAGHAFASRALGVKLGRIEAGYEADLAILAAPPGPPLLDHNAAAALVFRLSSADVRAVMVAGELVVDDGASTRVDAKALAPRAEHAARALWDRMARDRAPPWSGALPS